MRHFWVFETLLELRDHALENGFAKLASALQETIKIAHCDIDPTAPGNSGPPIPPASRR